jgi:hypothetical protein
MDSKDKHPGARCGEHPQQVSIGTCERCGSFFCQTCASPRDTGRSFCRRCGVGGYIAWEDQSLGLWARYYRTVRSSLLQLPRFAAELPEDGGFAKPLAFALLPTLVSAVLGAAAMSLFGSWLVTNFDTSAAGGTQPPIMAISALMFVFYGSAAVASYLAYLAGWPLLLVGSARLFGSRALHYRAAFRALCYASGLNWLYWVPVFGLAAGVYHFAIASMSIAALSRTSELKGFAICGVPAALCGIGCCGGYTTLILLSFARGN